MQVFPMAVTPMRVTMAEPMSMRETLASSPRILRPTSSVRSIATQVIQFGLFVGVNEAFNGSATVRVAVDQVTGCGCSRSARPHLHGRH